MSQNSIVKRFLTAGTSFTVTVSNRKTGFILRLCAQHVNPTASDLLWQNICSTEFGYPSSGYQNRTKLTRTRIGTGCKVDMPSRRLQCIIPFFVALSLELILLTWIYSAVYPTNIKAHLKKIVLKRKRIYISLSTIFEV